VPKDNPNWKGPWDCAEFVSWVVYQAAALLYGCQVDDGNPATADAFTGYWARDVQRFGRIISIDAAANTEGAAVLRLAVAGGLGGHIVLSDGAGGTIEAHSSADGVIRSKLQGRRWDYGICVPGVTYAAAQEQALSISPSTTVVSQTDDGTEVPNVRRIQKALRNLGYDPGPTDGVFGHQTTAAVLAFQVAKGLAPDGEVGKLTAAALNIRLQGVTKG
jgi:murein L,D-transpeptidase YcbB/YkuD